MDSIRKHETSAPDRVAIRAWLSGNRPYEEGAALYKIHGKEKLLHRLFAEPHSDYKQELLASKLTELVTAPGKVRNIKISIDAAPANKAFVELKEQVDVLSRNLVNVEQEKEYLEDEKFELEEEKTELTEQVNDLSDQVIDLQDKLLVKKKGGWPAIMDAQVQQLHDEWLPLFSEKKNLQGRIYDIAKAGKTDKEKKLQAGNMAHRILHLRDRCRKIYSDRDWYLEHGALPVVADPIELPTNPNKYPTRLASFQRYVREYRAKIKDKPNDTKVPGWEKLISNYEWGITELKKRMGLDAV
jgi:hypothetical protein